MVPACRRWGCFRLYTQLDVIEELVLPVLSRMQGASSPTDIIDTVEDKTHIEENLGDIAHNLTDKDDEALMPVDGVTTQKEDQEEEEAPQEGRVSQMDSIGEDLEELPRDSARVSGRIISAESPPVCASKV